jgi:sirohydrochlorin ferrochelatase
MHLLLVAHGSRRAASNEEVKTVVDRLRAAQGGFASIEAAFLELADPSIEDGLATLAGRSARHIVVMPYFLAAGSHVTHDIPEILEVFRVAHPGIHLTLKQHIGCSEGMGQLILDMASV